MAGDLENHAIGIDLGTANSCVAGPVAGQLAPETAVIPRFDWNLFKDLPKFDIRNGNVEDVKSIVMNFPIGTAYHWVPITDLHPDDAIEAMDAFIVSHHAHMIRYRPGNVSDAQMRKIAICLGVARSVSTAFYKLGENDFIPGERAAPVLRAARNKDNELVYTVDLTANAKQQPYLVEGFMNLTLEERAAICALVKCAYGVLPMQGYSLIMHHDYFSGADSQSRKVFAVAERAYWTGQDVAPWFTADTAIIQDALWYKSCHPVRIDLKTRLAMEPNIGVRLSNAGAGACASRLPAEEAELRTAKSYLTLIATVNPMFSMFNGGVSCEKLTRMVEIVKAYPPCVADPPEMQGLPAEMRPFIHNRKTALAQLGAMLKRNQGIVAFCYGFYVALSESNLMMGAGAGAQSHTLKMSYSLTKLKSQCFASFFEGYQYYGDYQAAVRNLKR